MIKQISHNGKCLAIFISNNSGGEGTQFITPRESGLQVGIINRQAGEAIRSHRHLPVNVSYQGIKNEFIYVKLGKVTVSIFTDDGQLVHQQTLGPGESFIQLLGGHGFYFEEITQLFEVKQGPYTDQYHDKEFYEATADTSK